MTLTEILQEITKNEVRKLGIKPEQKFIVENHRFFISLTSGWGEYYSKTLIEDLKPRDYIKYDKYHSDYLF